MSKRVFSDEFKAQVIKEAIETGNCSLVARKYELSPSLVAKGTRKEKGNPLQGMINKGLGNNKELKKAAKEKQEVEGQNQKLKKLIGEKELEIEILRDLYILSYIDVYDRRIVDYYIDYAVKAVMRHKHYRGHYLREIYMSKKTNL
jgi:transposase